MIERREPRNVLVGVPDADPAETALLERRGFSALLMLPLSLRGQSWGLVEIWRERAFADGDVAAGTELVGYVSEQLARLEQAS